jgi:hypothetical protein
MSHKAIITTIQPTSGLFTSFQPRSAEGAEKKLEVFATFSEPTEFSMLTNADLKAFCIRAYGNAVNGLLRIAAKAGHAEFPLPSIAEMYAETKREFLITKKDLEAWLDNFALPIIAKAISSKSGLHIDSPKVVKKVIAYKELMLAIASRSIMQQEEIDSCLKVLELVDNVPNEYTNNVSEALGRKQEKLNDKLAGINDDDLEDVDF